MLLFVTLGCREKPIDQGALITARTVGLDDLQRGRLDDAEREFKRVIAIAPRDPLGYANLGLTYLRAARYRDAESQLERARRLDGANVDVALTLAKLYSRTDRPAEGERHGEQTAVAVPAVDLDLNHSHLRRGFTNPIPIGRDPFEFVPQLSVEIHRVSSSRAKLCRVTESSTIGSPT